MIQQDDLIIALLAYIAAVLTAGFLVALAVVVHWRMLP